MIVLDLNYFSLRQNTMVDRNTVVLLIELWFSNYHWTNIAIFKYTIISSLNEATANFIFFISLL